MTDIEALKEALSEELYAKEPLARAIMSYLQVSDPAAHREILDAFDKIVSMRIDNLILDALENESNIEQYKG